MDTNTQAKEITATDVYDHATQAKEIFGWLEAISRALIDASEDKERDRSGQIKKLAGLANYLAQDWGNHFDCVAGDLAKDHGFKHP